MRIVLFSFLTIFLAQISFGQELTLFLEGSQFPMEKVRVHRELDFISNETTQIADTLFDKQGTATLSIDIDHYQLLTIKVRNLESQIWVAPGDSIHLSLSDPRMPDYPGELRLIDLGSQKFYEADLDSCTNLVYDTLHDVLRNQLQGGRNIDQLLQLGNWVDGLSFDDSVRLHGQYLIYGALGYAGYSDSLIFELALNKQYHPAIPGYRILFEQYYSRHLLAVFQSKQKELTFARAQNELTRTAYQIALDDPYTYDELIDLILFSFFKDDTYLAVFSPSDRYRIISFISVLGNPESEKIYRRIRAQERHLSTGTDAPLIDLLDNDLVPFSFNQDDRMVLLCFVSQSSTLALREVEVIEVVAEENKKDLRTCVIRVEKMGVDMQELFSKKANLEYYYFQQDWDLVEEYRVQGYPRYFLISADGRIVQSSFESILGVKNTLDMWKMDFENPDDPYGIQERMNRRDR